VRDISSFHHQMCQLILCDASVPQPEGSARAVCMHAMAANLECKAEEGTTSARDSLSGLCNKPDWVRRRVTGQNSSSTN
jgi:hypothetical protein